MNEWLIVGMVVEHDEQRLDCDSQALEVVGIEEYDTADPHDNVKVKDALGRIRYFDENDLVIP